jgi:hypothetical protein
MVQVSQLEMSGPKPLFTRHITASRLARPAEPNEGHFKLKKTWLSNEHALKAAKARHLF